MKTLGLIGGMSWESTAHYYQRLNQLVAARLGGWHSARLVLWNVEFDDLARLQHADDWDAAGDMLADAARRLEHAGAEGLLICANTMHRVAPAVEAAVAIMRRMHAAGAQAAILGCTEFGMLVRPEDAPEVPRLDTTELHCRAAVDWMLA